MPRKEIPLGTYRLDYLPYSKIRVQVEIEITSQRNGPRLSICSTATGPRGYYSGGQAVDEVKSVTDFAPGWDAAKRDRLVEIWDRWHLNDMRAGCEHQRALGWGSCPGHYDKGSYTSARCTVDNVREGCQPDMVSQPCPECGYKYGSAWLYEPLPEDVLEFIRSLLGEPCTVGSVEPA